jgi:hypothetical protein
MLVPVAEPDVLIRAVGRRYQPSLCQVLLPRAIVERAEHARGRGRQPPDDRVLDGSYPLPPLVVQELAKPETRPEHAGPGLGAAPELDDEPGPVPAKCVRTARRLNPGDDELLTSRPLPDRSGRCAAALEALSGKARSQGSQSLPVNHPGRNYAVHQPTIAKTLGGRVDVLATPFVAGLVRLPDVDDLDGQVAGRAEDLVRQRGPVQQA